MATLVLGAVGAAVGGSLGGSILGMSGAVIGRAVGATVGRAIDQRVLGGGSEVIEHGRLDRLRLSTASEGVAIPRVVGRVRVPGQVIWTTPFEEAVATSGGGKGGPPKPEVREYSYSVSLAIALCEGEILRVGRVWADGRELSLDEVPMRVHRGGEDQAPDPLIEAVEGVDGAPAYRGTAYVVMEDLQLGGFGNRVPQFSFEVVRAAVAPGEAPAPHDLVRGVALIPGTGEHALATEAVSYGDGTFGEGSANVNSPAEAPDFAVALRDLREEVPNLRAASLVVSWFGDDLRCGACTIRPKVERKGVRSLPVDWAVSGLTREEALAVPRVDGRSVYGGTPSDASVMQAIRAVRDGGQDVTYYPFILMDQLAGNGLPDPYGRDEQPPLPWRGRITSSVAPGLGGSPDGTATAAAEVAAFFGTARAADFAVGTVGGDEVDDGTVERPEIVEIVDLLDPPAPPSPTILYAGPEEWSYRRFILHQAALCAAAGGVEAFCIGSEMVWLTRVRGPGNSFPAVEALRDLLREVRILLPDAKLSYAADWSEYFGYHPGGDAAFFHLDPLWADPDCDFVGIDNYMPLSDWRDGADHADAHHPSIYDLDHLRGQIEGGEGYDWHYPSPEARAHQRRVPITDGAHGEPWVWRYKDVRSWWGSAHHDRPGGVRSAQPTAWRPGMKPIRFTEYGCAAIDRGTNQPNKFLDPKSSESAVPYFSRAHRDDAIQMAYLQALLTYWGAPGRNPVSDVYGGPMLDLDRSLVWAWDTRPWPAFPQQGTLWSDAANYAYGHWWSGRATSQPLANVIAEVCRDAGVARFDVRAVHGVVRGYALREVQSARADLQPLLLAHGVEVSEQGGVLVFAMREDARARAVARDGLVRSEGEPVTTLVRSPEAERIGRVRLHHLDAEGRFEARVGEAVAPAGASVPEADSELPLALTRAEGVAIAERFLAEAELARDTLRVTMPPSRLDVAAGDLVAVEGVDGTWRVDRIEVGAARGLEASRVDPSVFAPSRPAPEGVSGAAHAGAVPVTPMVLDLPLLTGSEDPAAPYVAARATPWPGAVVAMTSEEDAGYRFDTVLVRSAIAGRTETPLAAAAPGVLDRGPALRVRFGSGRLGSVRDAAFLSGANLLAVGDGHTDGWELLQFQAAEPVAPGVWDLSLRLRGQRGTEGEMRDVLPAGSVAVVVDGGLQPLAVTDEMLGLERYLRIGPARFAADHESYLTRRFTPRGIGLRPYAPAHLRHARIGGVDRFTWLRRTRTGGDDWAREAPVGERDERYVLRARMGDVTVLEREVGTASLSLGEAERSGAGLSGPYVAEVAQVSDAYGPGAWASVAVA